MTDDEEVKAVNGISFSLNRGESLGLVGETGAGKTTTALSIMQLIPDPPGIITEGEILFEGKNLIYNTDAENQKIRGNGISMIFQDPMTALNPIMTVGDQLTEALIRHQKIGKAEAQKKVKEMLEVVGVKSDRFDDYPHQFSGGMKQRVVIAIALACNPKLLIADEPTTALDVTIQAQVLAMMTELKEKLNTAMIMITHDLGIIAQTCDKVAVMYAGEIIEYGSVEDLFTGEKHHPYTVGLFGSIPNLEEDEARLHPIEGMMPDPTDLPSGCAFSPRCPHCTDRCKEVHPQQYGSGEHKIRCLLFEDEQKEV